MDRLEDRRREYYPRGREAYLDDRNAARDLDKDFAEAVLADAHGTAECLLQELMDMADQWKRNPHHPARSRPRLDDTHTIPES